MWASSLHQRHPLATAEKASEIRQSGCTSNILLRTLFKTCYRYKVDVGTDHHRDFVCRKTSFVQLIPYLSTPVLYVCNLLYYNNNNYIVVVVIVQVREHFETPDSSDLMYQVVEDNEIHFLLFSLIVLFLRCFNFLHFAIF